MKKFPRLAGRLLALLALGSLGLSSCKKDETTTVYGNWKTGNAFPGSQRSNAVSFVIGGVAYMGTGWNPNISSTAGSTFLNDFYSFTTTGGWQPVTPFPGGGRHSAIAFAIGNYGYVGTGLVQATVNGATSSVPASDFWQFDPKHNTDNTLTAATGDSTTGRWTRKQDFPASNIGNIAGRYGAFGASIGNFGYAGAGFDGSNNLKDFYSYDPSKNLWTTRTQFDGAKRIYPAAFTVNNILYVGAGTNNGVNNADFFAYNPTTNTWATKRQLANISTSSDSYDYSLVQRTQAAAFSIGDFGYITTGSNGAVRTDCYKYDPSLDTWTLMNPFKGVGRVGAVAFTINGLGYVGTGGSGSLRFDDFWTFDPNATQE
jgi:N-acetylneuraminic acid mutarotase